MKSVFLNILGIIVMGIAGLLCSFLCILSFIKDAIWKSIKFPDE